MGRSRKRQRSSTDTSPEKSKSGETTPTTATSVTTEVLTSLRDMLAQQQAILSSLVKPAQAAADPLVVHCKLRAHMKEDEALATPFEIANPRVLKEPWMWPIFWAHAKITRLGILDSFGLTTKKARQR